MLILGDPRYYGRLGFHCAERFGIAADSGEFMVGLLALELIPGSLCRGPGRFREGFVFQYEPSELAAFDGSFPPREKMVTQSQQTFQVMCSLHYSVQENGYQI